MKNISFGPWMKIIFKFTLSDKLTYQIFDILKKIVRTYIDAFLSF